MHIPSLNAQKQRSKRVKHGGPITTPQCVKIALESAVCANLQKMCEACKKAANAGEQARR